MDSLQDSGSSILVAPVSSYRLTSAAIGARDTGSRGETLLRVKHCLGLVRIKLQQQQEQLNTIEPPRSQKFHRVSINIRNGVTGSLDDIATLKLVDQEDEQDEDLLPQAAAQVHKVWLSRALLLSSP